MVGTLEAHGLKRSHLAQSWGLENFDFSLGPQLKQRIVKELQLMSKQKKPPRWSFLSFTASKSAPDRESRVRAEQSRGWFAAGTGFRNVLILLADGAFELFAHLLL
jgi:hypothetical protein